MVVLTVVRLVNGPTVFQGAEYLQLYELDGLDLSHRQYFQFSILQVFSPSAPAAQVDAAEVHFKKALLTRQFGLNRN